MTESFETMGYLDLLMMGNLAKTRYSDWHLTVSWEMMAKLNFGCFVSLDYHLTVNLVRTGCLHCFVMNHQSF